MTNNIEIGDRELFIQNILLRIFEKVVITSYPLLPGRKKLRNDGDIHYLAIYIADILFNKKIQHQELIFIWNKIEKQAKETGSLIANLLFEDERLAILMIKSFEIDGTRLNIISDRIDQIMRTGKAPVNFKGAYIEGGKARIYSRFQSAIQVDPRITNKPNILETDYMIYMLFFNTLKQYCVKKRGNTEKNVLEVMQKFVGHGDVVLNEFEKENPYKMTDRNKFLLDIFGKSHRFFAIAKFFYWIPRQKNEIISYLMDNCKGEFRDIIGL